MPITGQLIGRPGGKTYQIAGRKQEAMRKIIPYIK